MEVKTEFQFAHVAFFGRGIEEYVQMFDLNIDHLKGKSILDVSAGPASFTFEATNKGLNVTAVDPMYGMDPNTLRAAVDRDANAVMAKQAANKGLLYEEVVPTPVRRESMELFLSDFEEGKQTGRYIYGQLPVLPFEDNVFDLVLSANFLFEYSDTASGGMLEHSPFDLDFHREAIQELLRVAREEIRIYPLIAPGAKEHKYVEPLMKELAAQGHKPSLQPVKQKDIIGAEVMLQIIK